MFNLNIIYKSKNLSIYYTEDFRNNDFLKSLNNNCYIFYQFPWNIESIISDFPFDCLDFFPSNFDVKNNIIWCAPNNICKDIIIKKGYTSILSNHNCLLDFNLFNLENNQRIYDAVINARPFWWKRVYLANKIKNLVYIKGFDYANNETSWDGYKKMDLTLKSDLSYCEIKNVYNQAKVGLVLSGNTGENQQGLFEGANYSTGEYLLCGLPVVSTQSQGGRSEWFDDYNSIICEPNEDDVLKCTNIMLHKLENKEIDRDKIRNDFIEKMLVHRKNLNNCLQSIFDEHDITIDAEEHFNKIYFNKFVKYNNIEW